jgi:hypothetical protein
MPCLRLFSVSASWLPWGEQLKSSMALHHDVLSPCNIKAIESANKWMEISETMSQNKWGFSGILPQQWKTNIRVLIPLMRVDPWVSNHLPKVTLPIYVTTLGCGRVSGFQHEFWVGNISIQSICLICLTFICLHLNHILFSESSFNDRSSELSFLLLTIVRVLLQISSSPRVKAEQARAYFWAQNFKYFMIFFLS